MSRSAPFAASRRIFVGVLLSMLANQRLCWAQSASVSPKPPVRVSRATPATPTRPVPTATYWFLGAAVGSFGTAGLLLSSALASRDRAEARCAPKCRGERPNIQITLATADVMAIAGITCSVLALYSLLKEPDAASPSATRRASRSARSFDVRPVREGAVAELVFRF